MIRPRILLAAAAVLLALGAFFTLRPAAPGEPLLGAALAQEAEVDISSIEEMVQGDPNAPVEVIEYASYTCPHCANFAQTTYPQLKADYIDTGEIRFVYREVYFDRLGLWASMVARCGGAERFFGISDLIYERQRDWTQGDPAEIAENLRRIGRTAGLNDEQLDACLTDAAKAQSLVAWYEQNLEEHDVQGTPTFIINGEPYRGNMGYEQFAEILDAELEEAGAK